MNSYSLIHEPEVRGTEVVGSYGSIDFVHSTDELAGIKGRKIAKSKDIRKFRIYRHLDRGNRKVYSEGI